MIEARRSIFSRLVAGAMVLSLVLLAGLWWLTHQTVSTTLQEAARAEVDVDLAGLADIYATGGKAELEARIADRIALTPMEGSASHYLLADDRGRRIAGDLAEWPSLDPAVSESGIITIGANSRGFARAVQLGPDLRLVVARGIDIEAPVLSSIAMAFAAGGSPRSGCNAVSGASTLPSASRRTGRALLPQGGSTATRSTSSPPTAARRWRGSMICWRPTRTPPNSSRTKSARRSHISTTGW